jgi:hypothetical protein
VEDHAVTLKGTAGTLKAKVATKHKETNDPRLFSSEGVCYTYHVPPAPLNVNFIINSLKTFLKALGLKPDLVPGEWIFSGRTPPAHPSRKVEPFKAEKKIPASSNNPLFLLDFAQAEYFLFLKLKRELAASPCPSGQGQEDVGGGHQHSDQRRLP